MPKKEPEHSDIKGPEEPLSSGAELSYVYVLGSDGAGGKRSYVGWTLDLDKRLELHNSGRGARSTRGRSWSLLYAEQYTTRAKAQSREWYLKRQRNFRRSLLKSFG